jgi:hypothetical protein
LHYSHTTTLKKTAIISGIFLLFTLSFCHKENGTYRSEGTILGPDIRMCACCGGWYIRIDTTTYEFDSLPAGSGIDLEKETFPLKVRVDWTYLERAACPYRRIEIQKINKE